MSYTYPFKDVDEQTKYAVWSRGKEIIENGNRLDKDVWRSDMCGHTMKYSEHGNTNSDYGWEIDHIRPTAKDGSDDITNLQPLYWENNRAKGDTYPWDCT